MKTAVDTIKSFLSRHYPRNHMTLAAVLTLMLFLALLIPSNESVQATQTHVGIPLQGPVPEIFAPSAPVPDFEQTAFIDSVPDIGGSAAPLQDRVIGGIAPVVETAITETAITERAVRETALPPQVKSVEVRAGDNLSAIFSKVGLSDRELFAVLNSNEEAKVLNRLYPGYQLSFHLAEPGQLQQLEVLKSPLDGYVFTRKDSGYGVEIINHAPEIREAFKSGTVVDSLFTAGQQQQIPTATIIEMAEIFGGVIDFILDPRAGDNFSILYEEKYLDGKFVGTGEILAAQFTNQGRRYVALRYENQAGDVGYYNPEGESMRKAFLRSPLDVFRISSNFNPSRRHPILNTIRAHKGTDYAAPTGTPIRATSAGRVTWAARNGSFGKLVVITHNGGIETKYAHLNDYGKGIRKGARVRQGDVIGYVGATGGATGPHLHYEFLLNGVHQNPRTILDKLPQAVSLEPAEMDRFLSATADLLSRFKVMAQPTVLTLNQSGR